MADQNFTQFFIKLFDNKTLTLQFPINQTLTPISIIQKLQTLTNFPIQLQETLTLTLNGKLLTKTTQISPKSIQFSTINLTVPFCGGKGGFGSLLRGAATKAGQKKTNNFDACRDMSGRRLRHVNAEKRLEEWKEGEEERKLEKMAEEYLKKMEKKGKGKGKDDGAAKYVEKYREDSRKCVEEVERSVRECFVGMKRKKKEGGGGDAKKLKIWMGKRKMGESESDSDDSDSENDDSGAENEKSVLTENGNQSDSSKDTSCASVSAAPSSGDNQTGGSSDSGSEEERVEIAPQLAASPIGSYNQVNMEESMGMPSGEKTVIEQDHDPRTTTVSDQVPTATPVEPDVPLVATDVPEINGASECKSVSSDDGVTGSSISSEALKPLNFDNFNSAVELEVLGMERLKSELQERGLKCGGTLQERAARLFLLKTTPLEKLPKKLLAKK